MTLGATPVVRKALLSGEIDIYIEYTGNAGFFFNVADDPAWKDLDRGYALGAKLDYQNNHIVWLTPARVSNAWALAVRQDVARAQRLRTMSDFARWVSSGGDVVLACSAEFANAGTLRSLEKTYGFTLRSDQLIVLAGGETSATIGAAAAGTNHTNVAMVYSTDGGIASANLLVLEDDRHEQPVYAPVPTIREAALKANPRIATLVKPLMESFDQATLQKLNARVQIDGESAAAVAEDYLKTRALIH
jgi:osmoprotectant transport system substrate-binding protein